MSTSQTPSPGRTPNGTTLPPSLRRKAADPLVRRKRPDPTRPVPRTAAALQVNGAQRPQASSSATPSPRVQPSTNLPNKSQPKTEQPQEEFEDFPVFTTKRALLEGVRHHIMRLLPNTSTETKVVDPTDEAQFVRPVRLHRRDPRARPEMQWHDNNAFSSEDESKPNTMDEKERAKMEAAKAEKQAEREANQAQIAPTVKKAALPKKKHLQKKTELVYKFSDSARKEKNQRIRYEESLPWHLEDFENKNIWAGSYEAALSECHVLLIQDPTTNAYQAVPVEKWYKFTPKNQFKTLTIEEAEARMNKKVKDPRWFMETQEQSERQMQEREKNSKGYSLFTRQGERGERPRKGNNNDDDDRPEDVVDADDIDYDYEEAFADDEENALFEGDKEESKQAEEKLMRERREANVFEIKEEKDYDEEEQKEKLRAEEDKKLKKKIEKALMKRERNFVYEDDSDRNPYASESESEDSDEEMKDDEEEQPKGSQEANSNDRLKTTSQHERAPSAASSRGTSTPSGKNKSDDPNRKKRRGSPYQSEASGNESSRKKAKKSHVTSQPADANANAVGLSISRPTSPGTGPSSSQQNAAARKSSTIKLNMSSSRLGNGAESGAGSGSDAEMSEASGIKKKTIKLKSSPGSQSASPNGSRAATPTPAGASTEANSTPATGAADNEPPPPLPTPEDIRSRIPPEGIELTSLMKAYGRRVVKNPAFVPLIKAHAHWVKEDKKFYPKAI